MQDSVPEPLGPGVTELQPDARAIPDAIQPQKHSAMREVPAEACVNFPYTLIIHGLVWL